MDKDTLKCPYCGSKPSLVESSKVQGKTEGFLYLCANYPECDAYVGVHESTLQPLGRLADKDLRYWKIRVHDELDPLWINRILTRKEAYQLVAYLMDMDEEDAHIGFFDRPQCIELFNKLRDWKMSNQITQRR